MLHGLFVEAKIGNLLEQSYYEMFASPAMGKLMAENMMPRFSRESLCKTCDRATVHRPGMSKLIWQSNQQAAAH